VESLTPLNKGEWSELCFAKGKLDVLGGREEERKEKGDGELLFRVRSRTPPRR